MAEMFSADQLVAMLNDGQLEVEGIVPWGSNYTFLVHVCHEQGEFDAIYKPGRGERPLWDFAKGTLCLRERAAYLVSEALSWNLVPPTILRKGPHGRGSIQQYVAHDPEEHYLTFQGRFIDQLQRIALFDVIINNADRKSGHVLLGEDNHIWAIDHGVCFHTDYKLRTVIWEFAGETIPTGLVSDMVAFQQQLENPDSEIYRKLCELLVVQEIAAMTSRIKRLVNRNVFPHPGPGRHYPWPLV
ncbi:MAG: SCO1664 family protein [Candidatus Promineifilaceae bacterium]